MALVLPAALVQAKEAMALAEKQIDGVENLDSVEDRCPLAQAGQILLANAIDSGQQVNDAQRRLLQGQQPELPIRGRTARNESVTFFVLDLFPNRSAHPNIAVLQT